MECPHLIEAIFTTITDINNLDDLGSQPEIEHVALTELRLEVGATSKNQACNVDLVVGDEVLYGMFCNLADVIVTLFIAQTRETKGRLSSTSMLLW